MESDDDDATIRERLSLVQSILFIDFTDILPAYFQEKMVEKLWGNYAILVSLITDSGGNSWCPWLYFLRAYHPDNLCSSKSDVRLRFWSWYDLKKLLWPSWTQHSGLLCLWQCLEISFLPSTSLHTAARHKWRQPGAIKSHFLTMRGKYVSIDN